MNLHCHILAYNMTFLCLAPKELGMFFFAAGPRSINRACMAFDGGAAASET